MTTPAQESCDVCGRTLLRGERAEIYVSGGSRRSVCELCTSRALHGGWVREGEVPSYDDLGARPERRRSLLGRLLGGRREAPGPRRDAAGWADAAGEPGGWADETGEPAGWADEAGEPAGWTEAASEPTGWAPGDADGRGAGDDAGEVANGDGRGPRRGSRRGSRPSRPARAGRRWLPGPGANGDGDERSRASGPSRSAGRPARAPGSGASREPRHVHAVPTRIEHRISSAVALFNDSEHTRTIAGVARSLGLPEVSVHPSDIGGSVVLLVVCWELCWYRYEADLSDEVPAVRLAGQGYELSELTETERQANAVADERGRLHLA